MARYQIEGLREEIRRALLVTPSMRGQLDGFETVGYHALYALKPKHEECGVMVESEVVRTMACKSYKTPAVPLAEDPFKSARLVRAIKASPEPCADWLLYCYSEGARLPTAELLRELLRRFMQEEPRAMYQKSLELMKHLALLACQQKRDQIGGKCNLLTQVEIARLAGKGIKSWKKDWSPRWHRLSQLLDSIDTEGLNHVYESGRGRKAAKKYPNVSVQQRVSAATGTEVVACLAN